MTSFMDYTIPVGAKEGDDRVAEVFIDIFTKEKLSEVVIFIQSLAFADVEEKLQSVLIFFGLRFRFN